MQQTTFENIVAKGEISQNKQFILIATIFSMSSAADYFAVCGKVLRKSEAK